MTASQQKLLLVASAIIVGTSILAGMTQFLVELRLANYVAVMRDVHYIAQKAQAWHRLPTSMNGGGKSFAELTLRKLNIDSTNVNGSYMLTDQYPHHLRVTGIGTTFPPPRVSLFVSADSIGTIEVEP